MVADMADLSPLKTSPLQDLLVTVHASYSTARLRVRAVAGMGEPAVGVGFGDRL